MKIILICLSLLLFSFSVNAENNKTHMEGNLAKFLYQVLPVTAQPGADHEWLKTSIKSAGYIDCIWVTSNVNADSNFYCEFNGQTATKEQAEMLYNALPVQGLSMDYRGYRSTTYLKMVGSTNCVVVENLHDGSVSYTCEISK